MSAILDALKKTQSAIDNKPYPDRSLYGDIKIPDAATQKIKQNAALLRKTKNPWFSAPKFKTFVSVLKQRYVIAWLFSIFLCIGVWFGYQHDQKIMSEISKINNIFTAQKQMIPSVVVPQHIHLSLDGTVRVDAKQDAMINHALYQVGDTVNGYLILEIHENQVKLLDIKTRKIQLLEFRLI